MASTPKTKSDNVLYLSDVVTSKDNNLGVIIEMPDSDSDDDTDDEGLPKEAAMVSWYPSGEEEILFQNELSLKSRVLDPGMGVERAGDYRSGVLLDVTANCTVRIVGTTVRVSNVPGAILTPWNLHYHEPNVVYGSWLGYILQLQQTLVVGLKNGARVLMKFDTARHMEDSKFSEISPYYSGTWYVGQKLEGKARWFKRATLLSGTMPVFKTLKQKVKGVVLEAILTGIEVEWIMHGFMNTRRQPEPPPSLITGEHMLSKIRVFERYQQRFLTIGLPALLKVPPKYDIQELLKELETTDGRLPDLEIEESSETPIHQCTEELPIYPNDSMLPPEIYSSAEDKEPEAVTCPTPGETSHLMYETRIDDKTSAEVAKVEEQRKEAGPDSVSTDLTEEEEEEAQNDPPPGIFDKLATAHVSGDTDTEDESEAEEEEEGENNSDSSSEDSGLDESLETNKDKEEEKPETTQEEEPTTPDITATNQVSVKPESKRLLKRASRNARTSGWCSKISPKGPIEVKGQYLVEIVDATYSGKVLWEDGSREEVPCTQLNQIDHLDDHAHMPGYFVNKVGNTEELAVVAKYNSRDRTCTVHWLDSDKQEEEVSVYSLEYNRKYDFNPMDIIVCLVECSHSSIGQIICVTETGKLLVHWTDGAISDITPDKCVHLASSDTDYEDISEDDYAEADDDDSSWMTADSDFFSDQELGDKEDDGETKPTDETKDCSSNDEYKDATSEAPSQGIVEDMTAVVCEVAVVETTVAEAVAEGSSNTGSGEYESLLNRALTLSKKSDEEERRKALEALVREGEFVRQTSTDSQDGLSANQARKRFRNSKTSYSNPDEPVEMCEPVELSAVMQEHANIISESFKTISLCPESHHFYSHSQPGSYQRSFLTAVKKDIKLISSSLPKGIWVRSYEDRMDLMSCLIEGPDDTPYEGVLFVFDIQLPSTYSTAPPLLHYSSYSQTKLNPNLYPEGKVCLSLLGTWMGKGTEQWTKSSNLLQLLVSMQSLVLNSTPYYNEAGFNKYKETQSGVTNAKLYNEMVIYKILEHVVTMYNHPHKSFEQEIRSYYIVNIPKTIDRYNKFIECSQKDTPELCNITFPLLPLSKGVIPCITSRLNPLKIISAVDQIYNVDQILPNENIPPSDHLPSSDTHPANNNLPPSDHPPLSDHQLESVSKDEAGLLLEKGGKSEEGANTGRSPSKYDPGPPPMTMISGEIPLNSDEVQSEAKREDSSPGTI